MVIVISNGNRNKNLYLEEYLYKIRPYLRDIIIDLQESDTWKIQLTIAINFVSSKDPEEERVMHWKSDNIKFTYNECKWSCWWTLWAPLFKISR